MSLIICALAHFKCAVLCCCSFGKHVHFAKCTWSICSINNVFTQLSWCGRSVSSTTEADKSVIIGKRWTRLTSTVPPKKHVGVLWHVFHSLLTLNDIPIELTLAKLFLGTNLQTGRHRNSPAKGYLTISMNLPVTNTLVQLFIGSVY